ncbi:MAG: hypothetical protein L6Q66_06045 [Bacteroidia bacterium]|nr:hypothetical protein [Bacteroidia bacterium]
MKRKLHILTLSIGVLTLQTITGCKKYTCECTAYNLNAPSQGGQTYYKVKKRDRDEMCTAKSTQPDINGNYTTCVIK